MALEKAGDALSGEEVHHLLFTQPLTARTLTLGRIFRSSGRAASPPIPGLLRSRMTSAISPGCLLKMSIAANPFSPAAHGSRKVRV